jgi:hypothetical protein
MGRKGTQPSRVWAMVGVGCGLWCMGRGGGAQTARGGMWGSEGWQVVLPLGTGEWEPGFGVAVLGRRGVARGGAWGSEGWWVAAPLGTGDSRMSPDLLRGTW